MKSTASLLQGVVGWNTAKFEREILLQVILLKGIISKFEKVLCIVVI